MGQLNIPDFSRVYVDTAVIIYTVESNVDYWTLLQPFWSKFQAGEIEIISSELTLMEVLVRPLRINDMSLVTDYEQLLLSTQIELVPINQEILREAARLRSQTSLKTPDAIHAASHLIASCNLFLTNDKGFRNVPNLSIVVLSEVLAQ
ncbi:MAG: PIN domain-containing protein [Cyanobacteria bacterium J06592_8]